MKIAVMLILGFVLFGIAEHSSSAVAMYGIEALYGLIILGLYTLKVKAQDLAGVFWFSNLLLNTLGLLVLVVGLVSNNLLHGVCFCGLSWWITLLVTPQSNA
jgi:hypothetical protein